MSAVWNDCPRGLDQKAHENDYKHGWVLRRDVFGVAIALDMACVSHDLIDHAGNMYTFMEACGFASTKEQIELDALVRARRAG